MSQCSKCSSVNNSRLTSRNTSQISFRIDETTEVRECPICLVDLPRERMLTLSQCECQFCQDCLAQYVSLEILAGSYNIACPDPACAREGQLSLTEVEQLAENQPGLAQRHRHCRLETEVRLDPGRAWCPAPDCETVCHLCPGTSSHPLTVTSTVTSDVTSTVTSTIVTFTVTFTVTFPVTFTVTFTVTFLFLFFLLFNLR